MDWFIGSVGDLNPFHVKPNECLLFLESNAQDGGLATKKAIHTQLARLLVCQIGSYRIFASG